MDRGLGGYNPTHSQLAVSLWTVLPPGYCCHGPPNLCEGHYLNASLRPDSPTVNGPPHGSQMGLFLESPSHFVDEEIPPRQRVT